MIIYTNKPVTKFDQLPIGCYFIMEASDMASYIYKKLSDEKKSNAIEVLTYIKSKEYDLCKLVSVYSESYVAIVEVVPQKFDIKVEKK